METQTTDMQYAGFGRRLLAYGVDFLILYFFGNVIQTLMGVNLLSEILKVTSLEQMQQISSNYSYLNLISLLFGVFYFVYFWSKNNGQTPGKKMMAIKVVKSDGSDLTVGNAIIRYVGYFISSMVLCLGFFWIMFDKKKQGWHDKIAGTVVVKTQDKPKTALAVVLFILLVLFMSAYMGLIFYKSYELTMTELQPSPESTARKTINSDLTSIGPEAKVHYDKSQELFDQLQQLQPSVTEENLDEFKKISDENILECRKATELQPDNAILWFLLARANSWNSNIGSNEEGLAAYKKAEELDPTNYVYAYNVGDQLLRMGKFDESVVQLKKAIRLSDGTDGLSELSLARAYMNLKIYDSAKESYDNALALFEEDNDDGKYDATILQIQKELAMIPS